MEGKGHRALTLGLGAVALALVLAGCSGSSGGASEEVLSTPAAQFTPSEDRSEGSTYDSTDTLDRYPPAPYPQTALGEEDFSRYEVPGWTFDDLKAWYEEQMQPGSEYLGWSPCETIEDAPPDGVIIESNKNVIFSWFSDVPDINGEPQRLSFSILLEDGPSPSAYWEDGFFDSIAVQDATGRDVDAVCGTSS